MGATDRAKGKHHTGKHGEVRIVRNWLMRKETPARATIRTPALAPRCTALRSPGRSARSQQYRHQRRRAPGRPSEVWRPEPEQLLRQRIHTLFVRIGYRLLPKVGARNRPMSDSHVCVNLTKIKEDRAAPCHDIDRERCQFLPARSAQASRYKRSTIRSTSLIVSTGSAVP